MIKMNTEFENNQLAASRRIHELSEQNAKLLSASSQQTEAQFRQRSGGAVGAAVGTSGFSPLFLLLAILCAYVLGVYTSLATLPK